MLITIHKQEVEGIWVVLGRIEADGAEDLVLEVEDPVGDEGTVVIRPRHLSKAGQEKREGCDSGT